MDSLAPAPSIFMVMIKTFVDVITIGTIVATPMFIISSRKIMIGDFSGCR